VWTEGTTTVAWTPELEAETTGAHVAGMQFLSELRQYRERGKHSAEETRALLALAERAIKRNPDPAPD
jgi:hypothetical protein